MMLISLLSTPAVFAMELNDVVVDTISMHPEVKEKVHVYRQLVRDEDIAKSGWRPSIDLQASSGVYDTTSPATGNNSVDYDSSEIELSLTQNLFQGFATQHQVKQNEARAQAALFDLYDQADNVALQTIQAYVDVIMHRQLHQLALDNVKSHESILAQIRERNASGVGRRSQLQQTEGRVARAHASLIAQDNNLHDAMTRLHLYLGRYVDAESLVEPDIPGLPASDLNGLIDLALNIHPAMKVAEYNIQASHSNYLLAKSNDYPQLDLRLASEWGSDLDGISGDTEETSIVLNFRYNFYNGGADRAEQQKRISAVYEQKEFSARVRRQIIDTLRLAWTADESLRQQLDFLDIYIVKANETAESYREEFFIGQRDLVDLLDANNELNTAQKQHTEAYFKMLSARYRIFEAIGYLFETLGLQPQLSEDNFRLMHIEVDRLDRLPLPRDEDVDQEIDNTDHCDNSLLESTVNSYGCAQEDNLASQGFKPNMPPTAIADVFNMDQDGVLIIARARLLENDFDENKDRLEIIDISQPQNGRIAFDRQKNLIYRPYEGFTGKDFFRYTISDGNGTNSSTTATITITRSAVLDLSKIQYVNFKYNKSELTDISKTKVRDIVEKIRQAGNITVEIRTHTDSIGSSAYNLALSQRRARALRQLIIEQGIPAEAINAVGKGESSPIADNDTKQGQAINRRGEFLFKARQTRP